jgi:hypothetical protein
MKHLFLEIERTHSIDHGFECASDMWSRYTSTIINEDHAYRVALHTSLN